MKPLATEPKANESRYELLEKIASGGMATVYVGRLRAAAGVFRLVAIKRAHAHLADSPAYARMFIEEARLAARIHHTNVVSVLDVEELKGELRLVMDYVEGASLKELLFGDEPLPPRLALRIALDACAGLHAAHELTDEDDKPLHIVHRDVSPHNILVGLDGTARVTDFGIAKFERPGLATTTGSLKGKIGYMAPEYIEGNPLDARADVFALGVVVWEALANRRLYRAAGNEVEALKMIIGVDAPPISEVVPGLGTEIDSVLAAALSRSPDTRFATAKAFATALETAARRADLVAPHAEVAAHVRQKIGAALEKRRNAIRTRVAQTPDADATASLVRPVAAPVRPPPAEPGAATLVSATTETSGDASQVVARPNTVDIDSTAIPKTSPRIAFFVVAAALALVGFFSVRALMLRDTPVPPTTAIDSARATAAAATTVASAPSPPPAASSATAIPSASASAKPPLHGALPHHSAPPLSSPAPSPSASPPAPTVAPNPY